MLRLKQFVRFFLPPIISVACLILTVKLRVEFAQNGFFLISSIANIIAQILKLSFVVLLICSLCKVIAYFMKSVMLRIIGVILSVLIVFLSLSILLVISRIILNNSRPASPEYFTVNFALVDQLSQLSQEMILRENIFWVGNGDSDFVCGVSLEDGDYRFNSDDILAGHDFSRALPAEDASKVQHFDSPFNPGHQSIDSKILSVENYKFCSRASSLIRKIGFDNVKLYRGEGVVQYAIYDFLGWDEGMYYFYFYSSSGILSEDFVFDQKLNEHWFYWRRDRFLK